MVAGTARRCVRRLGRTGERDEEIGLHGIIAGQKRSREQFRGMRGGLAAADTGATICLARQTAVPGTGPRRDHAA